MPLIWSGWTFALKVGSAGDKLGEALGVAEGEAAGFAEALGFGVALA
jgi:hypothetical protein